MNTLYPKKLSKGSHIRVIAPSRSLAMLSEETTQIANSRLESMGFTLSFGKHVQESDEFLSSSIEHRVEDLHEAFADPSVDGILTVIGGFNSNQLLDYIDWTLIKQHPKVFCGFSDITALNNSMFAKTGLVTYSGPHYSSFGQKLQFEFTQAQFEKTVMANEEVVLKPSANWFDDMWWMNQDDRKPETNTGFAVINEGEAEGTVLGANLCTLNLLQGTQYMPDLKNSVLFLEDDELTFPAEFDRNLQSLIHLPGFAGVKGILIGRFQRASKIELGTLKSIIQSKRELKNIPVVANLDFGHTDPKITIPIGGEVKVSATLGTGAEIVFTKH